jgi:hypothetical protein
MHHDPVGAQGEQFVLPAVVLLRQEQQARHVFIVGAVLAHEPPLQLGAVIFVYTRSTPYILRSGSIMSIPPMNITLSPISNYGVSVVFAGGIDLLY